MDAMDTLYVEVSITNLPSVRYNRVVTQTYLDLVGNLSSNHFEKIVNEKKTYVIYRFSYFLVSVGGVIGLFAGASALNFIEIVYVLCRKKL